MVWPPLRQNIERGAADTDGRKRGRDLIGGFFGIAGHEAKCARRQPHRDVAIMVFVVTRFHFKADRLSRHCTGSRVYAMSRIYHKRCPIEPMVSDGGFEVRSMRSR